MLAKILEQDFYSGFIIYMSDWIKLLYCSVVQWQMNIKCVELYPMNAHPERKLKPTLVHTISKQIDCFLTKKWKQRSNVHFLMVKLLHNKPY